MSDALSRCVGDVKAFVADCWSVSPYHRQGRVGDFDDLLSLDDVDHLVSTTGLRRPTIRLVQDGAPVDARRYSRSAKISGETVEGLIDPGRVFDLLDRGATVVLQSLQRFWAPLAQFCRELELALTHPVQANAYLSPAGSAGLAAHHDTHDVFVLQTYGQKHWVIHEPAVQAPLDHQRVKAEEAGQQPVLFEAQLRPGDTLYLPRGFVHAARAQESVSLHVTIGILAYTVADALHELVRQAADGDAWLRRSLPVGFASDPATVAGLVEDAACSLTSSAGAGATAVTSMARRFWDSRRPLLDGQLRQLVALDAITDATVVKPRPGAIWRLEDGGRDLRLLLGDRQLGLPRQLGPAMRRVFEESPLAVGDLGDLLDQSSRIVLVRRLVREGALVALHGE